MKLAEVVLHESIMLNGRETLRLTSTEHPTLETANLGAVSVRVGASLYIIPQGSIRWLRFLDDEPAALPLPVVAPPPAPMPPAKPGKRGGKS